MLVLSHIQDCNRHCTPWHQVKHLHRTVGKMNSKTPGLLFIEIPFLQPLTHTPHLSQCQNLCCQNDVKLFQVKSPSFAKRENVPPSFGPRPRGCKNGLLQPLWRNWYKYKQQLIKFVKRVGNDAIQFICHFCLSHIWSLEDFCKKNWKLKMVSTMLWLYELHAICCDMSFASIQDCTPSTATHMSTAPCGSHATRPSCPKSINPSWIWGIAIKPICGSLWIFCVDRKASKDPAWWWGIMPRTKSTAGSQTYLKESWEMGCANRFVTESHPSMFAGQ